jgi:hypothetical protein
MSEDVQPKPVKTTPLMGRVIIGVEKNTTVVFPVPMDIFQGMSLTKKS